MVQLCSLMIFVVLPGIMGYKCDTLTTLSDENIIYETDTKITLAILLL